MDYRLLLKAKWKEIVDHPLIQQFLSNPKNQQLLRQVMEEPNEENAKKLDSEFKQFYQKIRIIKYISTMIRIFSVDFDKRVKKKQQRFPLILDHPDTQEVKDPVQTDTYEAVLFNQQDLGEHLQDQRLYKAYQQLTDKQKMVLTHIYVEGQTMKEIADRLGEIKTKHLKHPQKSAQQTKRRNRGRCPCNEDKMTNGEMEELIETFTPMIKKKLQNTAYQEREDLEQELYIKLIEKVDRLIYQEGPGFWEFIVEYMTKL